jgi:hypothetical protein
MDAARSLPGDDGILYPLAMLQGLDAGLNKIGQVDHSKGARKIRPTATNVPLLRL